MHVRTRLLPFAFATLLLAPGAWPATDAAGDEILDEVVVTGTLLGEKLGKVPASVTVLGERTLRDAGQQHFEDVLGLVPNLNWAGGTSRPRYFQIRGIGEREQYEGAPNSSVGFLIDDIDFSGMGMPAELFDVRQIEVLRGPQGTAYGANALAGLIVVRGNEPAREAGYSLEATGGNYGTGSLGFTATGPMPVLDSAWRVAVEKYESDGFMRNAWLGRDDTNGRDELSARLKWHGELTPDATLDFTWLHADLDNGYDAWAIDNSRISLSDKPGRDAQRSDGLALKLTTAAGVNSLTGIGTYADSHAVNSYDADWGNDDSWAPYVYDYWYHSARDRNTGSFELRLGSPRGDVEWLIGAYALRLNESGTVVTTGHYVEPGLPDDGTSMDQLDDRFHATSVALFGQMNGLLAPRWHWSAGLRLEQRKAHYDDSTVTGNPCLVDLCSRDRMVGGQLSLSRDLAGDRSIYATLSRGYKAGGFNLGNIPTEKRRFDPEQLWNLETGLKMPLGGRGYADVALFYQWRRDQQVRSGEQATPGDPNTYVFTTINLPKGYAAGVEGSLQYRLSDALQIGASLGLLRTRTAPATVDDGSGNLVPVPPRENAHAPSYTAALNATWRDRSGLMARVDLTGMDEFYFDVPTDHDRKSQAYSLVNLKVGYEREHWSVHGWVRNAFNRNYAVRGFFFENEPPDWEKKLYLQRGDPRQFGATLTVNF
jgi:outer membrane receptor protein involved in Fe transport